MRPKESPILEYLDGAPVCRLCQYNLRAEAGCDVCLPVKPNLIWPVMHEVEATETAKALSQYTARMLRRQLKKLEQTVNQPGYDSDCTKEIVALSKALTQLTDQVRKIEDREHERVAALGFEEQVRLIVYQFFAQLPEQHQRNMLQLMRDEYARTIQPAYITDGTEHA